MVIPQVVRSAVSDQLRLRALPLDVRAHMDVIHLSQNRSRFNPDAPPHTYNCALTAIVMGLRELRREILPGQSGQDQIEAAARLATGVREPNSTTFTQRTRIFDQLDMQPRDTRDIDELLGDGHDRVIVLSGHAGGSGTWYDRYRGDALRRDGHHAVLAVRPGSGAHGWFVHDPNSNIGVIPTDEQELRRFFAAADDGSGVDVTSLILR